MRRLSPHPAAMTSTLAADDRARPGRGPGTELYHLATDPYERVNLAHEGHRRTPAQQRAYTRLRHKLARVEKTRLQPLPSG